MTLKQLRESKYLLQMEVAEKLDVSPATVSLWESGKRQPDLRSIRELAVVYAVTPETVQQALQETQAQKDTEVHHTYHEDRAQA
jgi:transcriptional regulator with XRE-family HTH domain